MVRIIGHGAVELGGQHHIVASTTGQGFPEDLLRLPTGVAVGGVDEGDARVQGLVDHLDGGVVVGIAPGAEHHGTQTEPADGDTGVAQDPVQHDSLL